MMFVVELPAVAAVEQFNAPAAKSLSVSVQISAAGDWDR